MIDATPHPGWTFAKLSDVTRKVGSGSTPRGGSDVYHSTGTPLIRSQNVRFEGFTDERLVFLDHAQVNTLRDARVQASDVLLTITGASIGRVCQVPHRLEGACVNQHVCIIRPITQVLGPEFLSAFLASPAMQEMIWTEQYGVTRQALTKGQILDFDVPLPPLAEQRRIVSKLEELLGKVSACRQRLAKIPTILKRFRQSVLAAACSGRLTADWREKNEREFDWKESAATDACTVVQSGSTPAREKFTDAGIPFLKIYNIVEQKIDFDYRPQFVPEDLLDGSLKRSVVLPGDVLMNIVGPPLGKVAIVPDTYERWNINQAIVLFRPSDALYGQFLYYLLCSTLPYKDILQETRGSAGQANISLSQCRGMRFPLPPIDEQREVVRRVQQLFFLADQLEARYQKADAHVERLRQAILAKAFRGELVPTEHELAALEGRDYESAEQLLARLRAERSTAEPAKPSRRPRKATPKAAKE